MKILFTNDPPIIAYGLGPGLVQIGQEIENLPLIHLPFAGQRQALIRKIDEFRPDVVFTDGDPWNFDRASLLEICAQRRLAIAYWATEDPLWFKEISLYCAKRADFVFTPALELVEFYRGLGKKTELLMFGCNPRFHRRVAPVSAYRHDIVFVGANYERRYEKARYMIEPLIRAGFDLKVWGQWWSDPKQGFHVPPEYDGGYLPYDQLPAVYSSAKIVLGLHLDDSSLTQTSVRSYEVLGCGAFYLTQYTKAHANLFIKGEHLEWAKDEQTLLGLVRDYLSDDAAREKIAQAGQDYVYKHHTVDHRAAAVVRLLQSA